MVNTCTYIPVVYETIIFIPVYIFFLSIEEVAISNMSNDKSFTTEQCAIFNVSFKSLFIHICHWLNIFFYREHAIKIFLLERFKFTAEKAR